MSDNKRLGKGLEALFGGNVNDVLEEIQQDRSAALEIKLGDIHPNPYQPRKVFDEEKIDELAQSIKEHGVFTPVLLRKAVSGYQLIAGERRFRATQKTDLKTIPAIILELDDDQMMEISLIENIQREDLNVVEEAQAYQTLIEKMSLTQDQLAKKVGKSRPHITNLLRILSLPSAILDHLLKQELSMGQVRPLINIEDSQIAEALAKEIIAKKWSARDVERYMKPHAKKEKKELPDYRYVESLLRNKFQTKISLSDHSIHIHYEDERDLNRILELMDALEN